MKRRTRRALEKGLMEIYRPEQWLGIDSCQAKTPQQLLDEADLWERHGYSDVAETLRDGAANVELATHPHPQKQQDCYGDDMIVVKIEIHRNFSTELLEEIAICNAGPVDGESNMHQYEVYRNSHVTGISREPDAIVEHYRRDSVSALVQLALRQVRAVDHANAQKRLDSYNALLALTGPLTRQEFDRCYQVITELVESTPSMYPSQIAATVAMGHWTRTRALHREQQSDAE
jgi:hypothetical protein